MRTDPPCRPQGGTCALPRAPSSSPGMRMEAPLRMPPPFPDVNGRSRPSHWSARRSLPACFATRSISAPPAGFFGHFLRVAAGLVALVPALCLGMDHTSCRCLQLLCRLKGSSVEAGLWLCSWRQDPWSPAVVLGGNIAAGFCPG